MDIGLSQYTKELIVVLLVLCLIALTAYPSKRKPYKPFTCSKCRLPIQDPDDVIVLGKGCSYHRDCAEHEHE